MNWHLNAELLDRLAADYTLGTMHGGARRRFEAAMRAHLSVAQAAARWDSRLAPLGEQLPPLPAGDALWSRIEQRTFGTGASSSAASAAPVLRWWQRWLAPVPAGALAFGLMLGVATPLVWQTQQADTYDTQLPESYVGVLATAQGQQGLIVSSLRHGKTVDLKIIKAVPVASGSVLYLWSLDAKGQPQRVSPLPALTGGFVSLTLPGSSNDVFARAVELAVTMEPAGAEPREPTLPYVYRGLCGKLWRVPPAPR